MKDTRMPSAYSANLVANSGNSIYGVSVIRQPVLEAQCPLQVSYLLQYVKKCSENVSLFFL